MVPKKHRRSDPDWQEACEAEARYRANQHSQGAPETAERIRKHELKLLLDSEEFESLAG